MGTFLGIPIIKIIVLGCLYLDPTSILQIFRHVRKCCLGASARPSRSIVMTKSEPRTSKDMWGLHKGLYKDTWGFYKGLYKAMGGFPKLHQARRALREARAARALVRLGQGFDAARSLAHMTLGIQITRTSLYPQIGVYSPYWWHLGYSEG